MTDTLKVWRVCHTFMQAYYIERDPQAVMDCLSDTCTWINATTAEYFCERSAINAYVRDNICLLPSVQVQEEEHHVVAQSAMQMMLTGSFALYSDEEHVLLLRKQYTMVFMLMQQEWKIQHVYLSVTEGSLAAVQSTREMGEHTLAFMQHKLNEKTEIIDMIDTNAKCGLKGSNDDETFSFYYVNKGLCRMLGYTYEEFMDMSHGHAVGMVYPPDLDKALEDVAVCFAKGVDYSTEYRIRKKDGSLMWVLDSGRKHENKSGTMQINSILMDITELKQSQIDLQLEQGRYRIAIENITDVMFEYDIQKDHLIKYVRKDYDRKNPVEKIYIDDYFHTMEQGDYIHLDDVGTLKAFLLDTLDEDVIHIRLYEAEDTWKWIEVHSSYLYEQGKLIKCIGIWKDCTSEKLERDHLINLTQRDALTQLYHQKSVEQPIQEILDHEDGAMMIMDIDKFKNVNDSYGHLSGNDILLAVKNVLLENSGENEFVCRIGGDEFMIFFPMEYQADVMQCAARILEQVQAIKVKEGIHVTLSIGIAYAQQKDSFQELFRRADEAMYRAKNSGRNQIALWEKHC